jgi:LmbE family N-acetylglucosaminyl deacetylase
VTEKILVIAAHPDDEILGMAGTIARHVKAGDTVTVLWVTDGSSTQYPGRPDLARQKDRESEEALKVLGVQAWIRGGLPDMRLDTVPHIEVNGVVQGAVERSRPDVVYCVHPDVNQDHRAVFNATAVATRPRPGSSVRAVLTYATTSAIEWTPPTEATFSPTWYVDISDELDLKLKSMSCYVTELRPWPHPRSLRAITAIAEACGSAAGVACAEPFSLVRLIERREAST